MTEQEIHKRGSTVSILIGVAIALLVALFVVPGYIAGWYCRIASDWNSSYAIGMSGDVSATPSSALRVFLAPAVLAEKINPRLQETYWNQFIASAEITFHPPMTWSVISKSGFKYTGPPPTPVPLPRGK